MVEMHSPRVQCLLRSLNTDALAFVDHSIAALLLL